jgi:transcriptional regulator with XRE-family HTH domain
MIGRRLKAARRAAGLRQRALSERMGGLMSDVAINKYEADRDMPSSNIACAGEALKRQAGIAPYTNPIKN